MSSYHFQNPASPVMEGIIHVHHFVCLFLIWIAMLVLYLGIYILDEFWFKLTYPQSVEDYQLRLTYFITKDVRHHATLETYWTLIPSVILVLIAVPSFQLLYSMETIFDTFISVKVTGHQWYWTYQVSTLVETEPNVVQVKSEKFDSFMITDESLKPGQKRLLTVDHMLTLPYGVHIKALVTSSDVIHSWSVPSLGVKIDAVPGRLNQIPIYIKREGLFFGQCSEICGAGHSQMPIVILAYDPV